MPPNLDHAQRARLYRQDRLSPAAHPAEGIPGRARHVAVLAGSLIADALLVVIGQAVFPSTRGYVHFQFPDYAKLTVIGVVIACVPWPVVTRVSSDPRWLFFRLAILVTVVLLLPDVYILYRGQPADAVAAQQRERSATESTAHVGSRPRRQPSGAS